MRTSLLRRLAADPGRLAACWLPLLLAVGQPSLAGPAEAGAIPERETSARRARSGERGSAEDREAEERKQPITFDLVYRRGRPPALSGSPLSGLRWLEDGEHYLQVIEGKPHRVDARSGERERWFDPEPMARALAELPSIDEPTARSWAARSSFDSDRGRRGALFHHENDLYYARLDGSAARRLTSTPEAEEIWSFSPDGALVAFVRRSDLWVVDVATATERALTTGGSEKLQSGKASWVYYEEVFDRSWRAYWWSSDSRRIAFLQTDSSRVEEFTVVDSRPDRQRVEREAYPRPGEPNPTVRLGTTTAAGGDVRWIDLSAYDPDDLLVTAVDWSPDGKTLYFFAQDRIQTWLDLCAAGAGGGRPRVLFRDRTQA
ncbi:MAG: DPP IV N-terminal domain-containing protein, partial [Planctomycetes bacterium]|nr:DPP IV N-terminal domain-containing protein [Planctomycetota bacterium]